ncbi:MAG: SDR family oxidoreductase [Firmicutes bacterium]|nr:SDR family oxidoreductase [Candidatus Colimorpha enterica]
MEERLNAVSNMNKGPMTALVTGAGTGIGRGIAIRLAKEGYDVALHYRASAEGALSACDEIRTLGRKAIAIQADISDVKQITAMFDECEEKLGPVDLFVNNAGITKKSPFLDTTEALFDNICGVDFKGAYFCIQCAAKQMIKHGKQGSIVAISSNNSRAHFAEVSVYGSVKAAMNKMVEHIALEMAKYGIRVNTVAPGWVDTGASRLDDKESTFYKIPLKKWATVDDVAEAVIYLSSAKSVTGDTLIIDNGALLLSDKLEKYGF